MSDVDVLVIGDGLASVAAACQAGRLGSRVVLATRGRQLALDATTQGVLTGTRLASALFLELLGGPPSRAPHEFEPDPQATAQRIDELLRGAEVEVWFETRVVAAQRKGSRVVGATLERGAPQRAPQSATGSASAEQVELRARVTIDASPQGDVLRAAEVPTTDDLGEGADGPSGPGVALDAMPRLPARLLGCARVDARDLVPPARSDDEVETRRARVRPGAIACGDLGLALATPGIETAVSAAAQVPFGALLPREHDGLLVAGALVAATAAGQVLTRHAPVACQTGQAAGAAAALSVARGLSPRALDVRVLQSYLIDAGAVLFPFLDVDLDEALAPLLQRLAVRGVFDARTPLEFLPAGRVDPAEAVAFVRRWSEATGREPPVRSALAQAGFSRAALATELERLASLPAL